MLEQNPEFITTQAGQRIALPHLGAQKVRETSQELIPRNVATGVIDQLELIEIDITQCVLSRRPLVTGQQPMQTVFELACESACKNDPLSGVIGVEK